MSGIKPKQEQRELDSLNRDEQKDRRNRRILIAGLLLLIGIFSVIIVNRYPAHIQRDIVGAIDTSISLQLLPGDQSTQQDPMPEPTSSAPTPDEVSRTSTTNREITVYHSPTNAEPKSKISTGSQLWLTGWYSNECEYCYMVTDLETGIQGWVLRGDLPFSDKELETLKKNLTDYAG